MTSLAVLRATRPGLQSPGIHAMNTLPRVGVLLAVLAPAIVVGGASMLRAQAPADTKTYAEVQTRGAIHEAFAQPYQVTVPIDPPVLQKPPDAIPEDPPDVKPEGAGVGWIPGYWAWDADNNEFIWISGVYRDAPGGRTYVPGYWEQTADGGWRWVHGFWAPTDQKDMAYLPQPPAPLETGPSLPPPGDDFTYVPGCWIYRDACYAWRPGYYMQCRPGMVWSPACYVCTPGGCLYVSGYWDCPLERRGLLFAPVVFRRSPWLNPGWAWRPSYVVGTGALMDSLFVDTRLGHYRYGDWYGKNYLKRGIQPWHQVGTRGFDPLFAYYRSTNRNGAAWQNNLVTQYNNRLAGQATLPPRSLTQQAAVVKQSNNGNLRVVEQVTQVAGLKLTKVTAGQLSQARLEATQIQNAGLVRRQAEAALAQQSRTGKSTTTQALKVGTDFKAAPSIKAAKADPPPSNLAKPMPTEAKHTPLPVKDHKAEIKPVQPQVKAAQSSPNVIHIAKSAGTVKSATPQPAVHHASAPAPQQVHASNPKPPPTAHASAAHSKGHGK
jgi:hypothetical protein